jgi:hypothetical protein
MNEAEIVLMAVFVGMGCYISYLHSELGRAKHALGMLVLLVGDIADGDVEIERTNDGIRIRNPRVDREVSTD